MSTVRSLAVVALTTLALAASLAWRHPGTLPWTPQARIDLTVAQP